MKFFIMTLGCKVNQYESQAIFEKLTSFGFYKADSIENADIIIINSCTVTAESDKKVRKLVHKARRLNKNAIIILTGCMAQAFKADCEKLEEVDIILGNSQKSEILEKINEFLIKRKKLVEVENFSGKSNYDDFEVNNFYDRTRAFVKIEDGCNRFCTYCIIPYARGRVRSKPIDKIYEEIKNLAENGYKEVVLVGINLFSYGQDIDSNLCDVIEKIATIDSLKRIRLGSLEPECMSSDVINRLSKQEKLCPQFHLSLQSGCNETLKRMNRQYTSEEYKDIVDNLRKYFKNPSITTDIMVGFAGETEAEFNESLDFVKSIKFSKIHVFPYSIREGTKAALFKNQVSHDIKSKRVAIMTKTAEASKCDFLNSQVGVVSRVLFEREIEPNVFEGYTENYTPVRLKSNKNIRGMIFEVKIKSIENDYCVAELIS